MNEDISDKYLTHDDYTARLDALDESAAEWERLDAGTPEPTATDSIPF